MSDKAIELTALSRRRSSKTGSEPYAEACAVLNLTNDEREVLRKLEEELWREETRFDQQRMDEIIAEDFFEFGMSGRFYRREDTLAIARQPIDAVLPLPDFQARLLAPDVAQVTYNSAVTYDGDVYHARRSSIWSRTEAGWKLRFHQGTRFKGGA
jgi:hypothetical protein